MRKKLLVEKVAIARGKGRTSSAVIVLLGRFVWILTVLDSGFIDGLEFGGRVCSWLHL